MSAVDPVPAPVALLQSGAATGIWRLDPFRSGVELAVRHLAGMHTVRGRFERFDGTVEVADNGSMLGAIAIEASSIETGRRSRDERLRGEEFLDVERYPFVVFDVCDIHVLWPDRLLLLGELSIRDRRSPLCFEATLRTSAAHDQVVVDAALEVEHTLRGWSRSPFRVPARTAELQLHLVFTRLGL
jgi:polyisoprenoid-binding protein YceI